jgi:Uma2 family endonuclease
VFKLENRNWKDDTFEKFEQLQEKTNFKLEYHNGAIYCMSPVNPRHNIVSQNISFEFKKYLRKHDTKCQMYTENVAVVFENKEKEERYEYEPDLMVVCDNDKFRGCKYYGTPLLVTEILSPSTKELDLGVKKDVYLKYEVAEYWIINIDDRKVDVYKNNDRISYSEGNIITTVLGNEIEVSEIFRDLF